MKSRKKEYIRVQHVCERCGSIDIVRDALVRWNVKSQDWELKETTGDLYCRSCNTAIMGIACILE